MYSKRGRKGEREKESERERERARDFIALDLSMLEARWVESFDTLQRTGWGIGGAEGKSKHTLTRAARCTFKDLRTQHVRPATCAKPAHTPIAGKRSF